MTTRKTQRLYMPMEHMPAQNGRLDSGGVIEPTDSQTHYLISVLRLKDGAEIRVFNENDGEFLARIVSISRKKITLHLAEQIKPPVIEPETATETATNRSVTLAFAPIRRQRMEAMIEKATECGVTTLAPVLTAFTQSPHVNLERLRLIATEAAEQSERMSVPHLLKPQKLHDFCAGLGTQEMIFCDEAQAGQADAHMLSFLQHRKDHQKPDRPSIILIGPEGGFSDQETRFLLDQTGIHGVSLGSNILRSDTAAILALGLWQASL
ncbi:MAG: 16S rRNA (uracil(1498)-N(3))-methyltransferase [Alphaproteobacteria bacterium]|nr:16S rRNA (uracil(1498)-N(3))-methyltransferase [Alphaproteobacteria bacterium]